MSRLDEAIRATMLNTAAQGQLPFQSAAPAAQHFEDDNWRFDLQYDGSQIRVANLEAKADEMWMRVCDSIHWGNPISQCWASIPGIDGWISLACKPQFLLRWYGSADGGHIPASDSGPWQLEADVSHGFQFVFGYEIDPADAGNSPTNTFLAKPFSDDYKRLIDQSVTGDPSLAPDLFPAGGAADSEPYRIVVCISLVCCAPRYDFDPGSVLLGARFYPLIEVISNKSLGSLLSHVRLARPERTMPGMRSDMMELISGITVTDRNGVLPLLPYWSGIFDYYNMAAQGSYRMAEAIQGRFASTRTDDHTRQTLSDGDSLPYVTTSVIKQPGQGQFDSIHLAPKMFYVPFVSSSLPATDVVGPDGNARASTGRYVSMAPFCQHDCLHMHWRWSTFYDSKWNCGWTERNGEYVPYAVAGAPLVPPNQSVVAGVYGSTLEIETTAQSPRAGVWQYIHHNGLGYAVGMASEVKLLFPALSVISWPELYDKLRFALGALDPDTKTPTFNERLLVEGSALQTLMDL
jgi:hypothetical protein